MRILILLLFPLVSLAQPGNQKEPDKNDKTKYPNWRIAPPNGDPDFKKDTVKIDTVKRWQQRKKR